MKKLLAIILSLLLVTTAALADVQIELDDTGLLLTLTDDMMECELTDEDIEDGYVLLYINDDETLEMAVAVFEDDTTLDELAAELQKEEGVTQVGTTVINGVEALFMLEDDEEEGAWVIYFVTDGTLLTEIDFWYADEAAAQQSGVIMGTLTY